MSDDMFKAAEINGQSKGAMEREKETKSWVEYHTRQEVTLLIVSCFETELENNIVWLTSKELEVLLRWKGVPVSKMSNITNRQVLHQQFSERGTEEANIPAPWIEIDQEELDAHRNAPIKLGDTLYGQFEEQKMRDIK